ncbi:probable 3-deoxy-D-manno-octulosonic acid transferase, mitochondrial isoform X2 [Beta vulgaris subsp. vulgaris]|uniref:probable 3-deoxy-D-manno-octulosonic acid transferase, mitochondrial isoform X2 n=1 Tax=Beta vulgaris subsp. vulgaris TaxID=3555 RepID=UPI002036A22B|nr:probable 3-deoxy-D-manno-octulosonic acid transferase, mitochondrial isoform X2 [Beta vulgaris subsp. vulgaris]
MKTAIMMMRERGKLVYKLYRALTFVISPLIHLHLHFRRFRGLEHSIRWSERLGCPSLPRPHGPLLWFHAVSLGEGMAAIPVIRRCLVERPDFNILMTTTTLSAFEVLKHQLPPAVMYQITLSLLNARMSERSFRRWSAPALSPLIALMLSKFSLIVPLSTREAIHFQLLQAPPSIVSNSADLKYCVGEIAASTNAVKDIEDLRKQMRYRRVWMASSVHEGELEVMLRVHETLVRSHSDLLTVIIPRHPRHALDFCQASKKQGLTVAVRSVGDKLTSETNIYVADTLGELREFYRLVPISLIGGSFLPTLAGHNISEAMVAGCAVLTGPHVGHFTHMVSAMQSFNPLSILQVSGEAELIKVLQELLSDPISLEVRQSAAKQAFYALSCGVLSQVWIQLNWFVFTRLRIGVVK